MSISILLGCVILSKALGSMAITGVSMKKMLFFFEIEERGQFVATNALMCTHFVRDMIVWRCYSDPITGIM
jgi:hypothetical protein